MTRTSKILMIHGHGAKPASDDLQTVWLAALKRGLERDHPEQLDALAQVDVELFYYADGLAQFAEEGFDADLDLSNRHTALDELAKLERAKQFRRNRYETLPGKTPLKEFAMDLGASLGAGALLFKRAIPGLDHYWQGTDGWRDSVIAALGETLTKALLDYRDVMVISHCMGSVLTWDALWHVSQRQPLHEDRYGRIGQWLTIGSPLASNAVQKRLAGADQQGNARYPSTLTNWHNIAAEDDYVCHDKTVADDFSEMLERQLIGDIRDHMIYNLSVRYGRSNPHSSVGYLIHPRVAGLLADWLGALEIEPNLSSGTS